MLPYLRLIEADMEFGGDDFHNADGPIVVRRFKPEEMLPEQKAFREACLDLGIPDCPDFNHPEGSGVGPSPLNNPNGIRMSTALTYLAESRHSKGALKPSLCGSKFSFGILTLSNTNSPVAEALKLHFP